MNERVLSACSPCQQLVTRSSFVRIAALRGTASGSNGNAGHAVAGAVSSGTSRSSARTSSASSTAARPVPAAGSGPQGQPRPPVQRVCCRWRDRQARCRRWWKAEHCRSSAVTSAAAARTPSQFLTGGSERRGVGIFTFSDMASQPYRVEPGQPICVPNWPWLTVPRQCVCLTMRWCCNRSRSDGKRRRRTESGSGPRRRNKRRIHTRASVGGGKALTAVLTATDPSRDTELDSRCVSFLFMFLML